MLPAEALCSRRMLDRLAIALLLVATGCSKNTDPGAPAEPEATPGEAEGDSPGQSPPQEPAPSDGATELTAKDCEAKGGTVVGDIGDGAIHRPDYRCSGSDQPPLGTIVPEPGGPIATEGAVCCPGSEAP